jgi:hypothetical protein
MASLPTTTDDAVEYLKQHGIYYLEDAAIGNVVKQVDDLGLSRDVGSWGYFKDLVLGNMVRRVIDYSA